MVTENLHRAMLLLSVSWGNRSNGHRGRLGTRVHVAFDRIRPNSGRAEQTGDGFDWAPSSTKNATATMDMATSPAAGGSSVPGPSPSSMS